MLNTLVTALAFAAGTSALSIRGGACDCSFHLNTSGNVKFPVGEDSEGEVLGGSQLTQASFCLNGNTIIDSRGNGCFFTSPTNVLQCDVNATPATGFAIACDGTLSFNGQTTFYECANGQGDEVNIYSTPNEGENCGAITLTADGCHAACNTCPAPTTVTVTAMQTCTVTESACPHTTQPPPPPPPTTTAPPPPKSTCPMDLPSGFEFPHLIVPVDSSAPNSAAGTSYFGEVSSTISSIFNFDVPGSDSGKTCDLWFLFPAQAQLTTSSYTLTGSGAVEFACLSGIATQSTTYANMPGVAQDFGQFTLMPGSATKIASFACPAGKTVSYSMKACDDTCLKYFQDYNPCPIGLYLVPN